MSEAGTLNTLQEAAVELSVAASGTRVLRFFFELPIEDAWTLLPGLSESKSRVAAWHSEEDGSFVAGGVAWEATLEGIDRFQKASKAWSELKEQCIQVAALEQDNTLPFCLSGFAFSHDTSGSADWEGWGDGRLWLPEWVVARVGKRCRAVLNARITESDDTDAIVDSLVERMKWLKRLCGAPVESDGKDAGFLARAASSADAEAEWVRRVGEARQALESGQVQKVVLARSEEFSSDSGPFDGIATAFRMRRQQAGCTVFLVRRKSGQAFVGATPEELIRRSGKTISTMSLAGTRRRDEKHDDALGEELLKSEKDRHEQVLVTQAMTQALMPMVEELVLARVPELAKLADVQHLRTRLRGTLRGETDLFCLAEALHPTPAVGGLPRSEALAWISENEELDRGWYAGPIGWLRPDGDGLLVVAIRSVLLNAERARAFVGCGLVENSDPNTEWEESEAKLQPAARGLAPRHSKED